MAENAATQVATTLSWGLERRVDSFPDSCSIPAGSVDVYVTGIQRRVPGPPYIGLYDSTLERKRHAVMRRSS